MPATPASTRWRSARPSIIRAASIARARGSPVMGRRLRDLVGGSHSHHPIRLNPGHASTAIKRRREEPPTRGSMVPRGLLLRLARVVWSAFVWRSSGRGVGFYGPPVYLHAVAVRTGWSLTLVSSTATSTLPGGRARRRQPGRALPAVRRAGSDAGRGPQRWPATLLGWAVEGAVAIFTAALLSGVGWSGGLGGGGGQRDRHAVVRPHPALRASHRLQRCKHRGWSSRRCGSP